jgi:hypothetical protein
MKVVNSFASFPEDTSQSRLYTVVCVCSYSYSLLGANLTVSEVLRILFTQAAWELLMRVQHQALMMLKVVCPTFSNDLA